MFTVQLMRRADVRSVVTVRETPATSIDGVLDSLVAESIHILRGAAGRQVRFRSLGCYPLTAAVESTAWDLDALVIEMRLDRRSERAGRLIDGADGNSMENKKVEGYF